MRIKAGNSLSQDAQTLDFGTAFSLTESGGDVTVSNGGSISPVYNVKQLYNATGDGTTNDTAAIQAAITAALAATGGGVVYLPPGTYRLATGLTIDGGIANAANTSLSQLATLPPTIAFICDGAIKADAGIGTALTVKQAINPIIKARFLGGGNATDVALLVQALYGLDLEVYAQGFAGTVCKADGTTAANNLMSGRVRSLRAEKCGQGINWKNINAFGVFDFIETINNQVAGDIFQLCADIDINYWNAYYGTGITDGITFDGCNNFNHVVIETGDRPTNSLVRVCADSGTTNFGRMKLRCSAYALAPPVAALELDEVSSGDFEMIDYGQGGVSGTDWGGIGVRVRGGAANDVVRVRHHSQTRMTTPMKVEAHSTSAPILRVETDYRFTKLGGILVDSGITGGKLIVSGRMAQLNQTNTASTYGVDCQATAMVVDVSDLEIPSIGNLAGAVNHANKNKIRRLRHAQLPTDSDTDYGVAWTVRPALCAGVAAWTAINQLRGGRVVCRKAGTVKNLYIMVGTASGNISVALYDTKVTTRTQLWTSGAIVCPAAGFQKIGDPNITVDENQQLLAVISVDNTTVTFLRAVNGMVGSTGSIVPAVLLPSPEGALVGDEGMSLSTAHPAPGTITESAMGVGALIPCVGFQIV